MAARGTGLPLNPAPGLGGPGPEIEPEERRRRLEETRRELGNRRKILIRNLPPDCCSQEIHDLLTDCEIKYCYVDKNKRTAFVTLLNGEQAQDAINRFHQYHLRDKEILVHLQPTDALLCVTNLPPLFSKQEFEELVRAYGNIERCLLVYSELTGLSKGYGFVEYMKKDCALKARLELLGRQLEECTLFAQWIDVNQLTADFIHSKCLCVDKLPKDYSNTEELTHIFSSLHIPVFCQLAEDEGNGGFAIVEYESAWQAEEMRDAMNQVIFKGNIMQVAYCAPGSPGRSVLATLMAAQGMLQNNRKGLLPEPNPAQIMQSLNNPAMLQMLLQSPHHGKSGKHGSPGQPHFVNSNVGQALLQLGKLHQKPALAGNALLQNFSHLQMAHQQLLQLKNAQSNNGKPGLLGEAPVSIFQSAMGTPQTGSLETSQKSLLSYIQNQNLSSSLPRLAQDRQPAPAVTEGSLLPALPQGQTGNMDAMHMNKSNNQTSLLGEPPKEIRLSTNPYLNLASVLPGMTARSLHAHVVGGLVPQDSAGHSGLENYVPYSQQFDDYSQEALQQWYEQYSGYTGAQTEVSTSSTQTSSTLAYGDYSPYVQAPPTYYTQGSYQAEATLAVEKVISNEKRPYLISGPELDNIGYPQQYVPAAGDTYADLYAKRKKVY
ncbi:ribonucleoprotein PTB-binding 2 [Gastrophryne carolinensis]